MVIADATAGTALERYLHQHIPLSRAMGVVVMAADADAVVLAAPLAPNINHRDTVFGGSAAAVALLAGWSLLYLRLNAESIAHRIVVQRSTMEYLQPIGDAFTAVARLHDGERWERFRDSLQRRRRARVEVTARLEQAGALAGRFTAQFVALRG